MLAINILLISMLFLFLQIIFVIQYRPKPSRWIIQKLETKQKIQN